MTTDRADHQEQRLEAQEQLEHRAQESSSNNIVVSVVLFVLLFGMFCAGLYVMSLFTPVTFLVGLALVLVSLYLSFDTVPRLLT